MACCAGKKSGNSAGIPTEMKEIKVEKFDELFKEGGEALQAAEDLRAGMTDAKAACMALSGAYTLKVGGMSDAVKCWLWSVCQEVGADKFATMKPAIDIEKEPHFNMEIDPSMGDANKEIAEAFKCYIETVCAAPGQIQTLTDKLKSVSDKAQELSGTAKDECTSAGLGAMDTAKAVAAIASNSKTLATGMTKLTALGPIAQEAATDMKDLAANMASILGEAAKNSDEGKGKGAKTAVEYCEKQHAGEKLAAKEAAKDANFTTYEANKKAGKKLPSAKKGADAAPAAAAEEAAPADAPAAAEDVKPELKDV